MTRSQEVVTVAVRAPVARLDSLPAEHLSPHEALMLSPNGQLLDDAHVLMSPFVFNLDIPPTASQLRSLPARPTSHTRTWRASWCSARPPWAAPSAPASRPGPPGVLTAALRTQASSPSTSRPFEIHRAEGGSGSAGSSPALPASEGPRILLVQSGETEAVVLLGPLPEGLEAVLELECSAASGARGAAGAALSGGAGGLGCCGERNVVSGCRTCALRQAKCRRAQTGAAVAFWWRLKGADAA